MATMGMLRINVPNPVLIHRQNPSLRYAVVILVAGSILSFTGDAYSNTEITPIFSIQERLVDNEEGGTTDSGYITTISPRIIVGREGPRSTLFLDYQLDAVYRRGFDEPDDVVVNTLNFLTDYQHVPGKWVSTFQANSRLTNIDSNGRQNLDPEFFDDNNAELRTLGFDTEVNDELTNSVDYHALVFANYATYADSDDGDDTTGQGLILDLNNLQSGRDLLWRTGVASGLAEDETDETQIDAFDAVLGYRIAPNWSPFITYTRTVVNTLDSPEFTDNKTLIGMLWSPNRKNYISIGAGERTGGDGDSTYSFGALSERRHLTFTASYSDDITIARATFFDTIFEDSLSILFRRDDKDIGITRNDISRAGSTSQSISIAPIREKIARMGVTVDGKRTLYSLSVFERDRSESTDNPEEYVTGLQFDYGYQLSGRDNILVTVLAQNTKSVETSDFWNLRANYLRQLARFETMDIGFGWTEQESTAVADEYKRVFLSARYFVTF